MLDFIINILATPAICVGLLAMVGLILQGKPVEEVVKGTIKTIVGFLVVSVGASYIQTGSLLAFGDLFNYAFNMQGVVPNNEAVVSLALTKFGADSAYIMVAGMILNIVLARFSNLKYIFLTGHHTLYMACMLAVILSLCGLSSWMLWIAGGCLLAFICAFSPWYCAPTMEKIVETDELGFGHFGGLGYWLSAQCGKLFKGKVNESTEDLNFPQRLTFLRDTTVSIGITMVIFFIVVTGVAVAKGLLDVAGDYSTLSALVSGDTKTHWLVWAITRGLDFSGAVYVILSGVRLIVSELVPAFKGIAEKLVPGAVPAIDCPVVFPYAPNAVLIGFLVSFVGGVVGLLVLALVNKAFPVAMILPGVVPHFFCGATAGVFGNAEGGWRGCLLGSFVHGLLITFLPAAVMPVFTNLGFTSATFSDADFSWMALVFGNLSLNVGATVMFVVSVVVFLAPIVLSLVTKKKSA